MRATNRLIFRPQNITARIERYSGPHGYDPELQEWQLVPTRDRNERQGICSRVYATWQRSALLVGWLT